MQKRRLRVAIFSNAYTPTISGVVTSVRLFRQGLVAQGQDVHVFTPQAEHYEDSEPYVYRLPALIDLSKAYEVSLALPLRWPMRRTMEGIKPHLIHSQHPALVGELALRYAQELRLPLVYTFHTRYDAVVQSRLSLLSDWAGQVAREVVQEYLSHCSHVIAPTESIRRMVHNDYDVDVPVTVLPTPIDLARFENLDPAPVRRRYNLEGKKVLMYLGRISPEKNLDLLIRAFARVHAQRPQTVLLIVGRGPNDQDLRALATSLHLDEHVIFAGAVPHTDVPQHMAAADLFTFASAAETQGLVLIEAMAAGTPIVAVRGPGADDLLADSGAGLLTRGDDDALADAILSLLNRPEDLAAMRQCAHRTVQRYSVAAATKRLLEVYERALSSGPCPKRESMRVMLSPDRGRSRL